MHPVCLAGTGISADYPGWLCGTMVSELPGNPLVMFGLGAAGDIDPPGVGVSIEQMKEWGGTIAQTAVNSIMGRLEDWEIGKKGRLGKWEIGENERLEPPCHITMLAESIGIPLRSMTYEEIDEYADKYLCDIKWNDEFGHVFPLAVEKWRVEMKSQLSGDRLKNKKIEISVLEIGILKLLFINAELFSEFERLVSGKITSPFMIISCANGLEGYFPDKDEYGKGGYEIKTSIFFYNTILPDKGSLEQLARESIRIINCF